MVSAKDVIIKPISAKAANALVKRVHYSGKVVNNSTLHLGAFLNDKLEGVMSFGSPLDKRKVLPLVEGTQCGDGTIYRASGFVLTQIKKNGQIWESPNGERYSRTSLTDGRSKQVQAKARATAGGGVFGGGASMRPYIEAGWKPLEGFQLRYIYFLNPEAKNRLTVPIIPFEMIDKMGASMYKGKHKRVTEANSGDQLESGGAIPTHALQSKGVDL